MLRVDGVHVVGCGDEGGHVDLIEVQAPNAMELAFDAGDGIDAESGRSLDVFPGNHGDDLVEGLEVDQWLDKSDALFQWAHVNEVGKEVSLEAMLAGSRWQCGVY